MIEATEAVRQIKRSIYCLGGATVLLFLVVAGLAVTGWYMLARQVDRNETARIALCFQRADVDSRIQDSKKLLAAHPHSKLIFRIPRTLIQSSLQRDIRTRHNLEILDC